MTKVQILLVVRWPIGGIRTFLRYVYSKFDSSRYRFSILAPENFELDMLAKDLEGMDIEFFRVSAYPTAYEMFAAACKLISTRRFNVVHSHGFTSAFCSALPAFVFRVPHIMTSHDMLSNAQFKGILGNIKKMIIGIALKSLTSIHLVSKDALLNLSEFYPSIANQSGKCVVIPNGIESSLFVNAKTKDLRPECNMTGEDCFLIGFLGRFMAPKGFSYLVEAIEQLVKSEVSLASVKVVAFGTGGFFLEEKAALIERGLEKYFTFLPFSSNVEEVIKGLDLVVIPSVWETCPLLPMEVLACGTPLLASNCIGLREVVQGTPAYVVPAKSSVAIAEGIMFFIEKDRRPQFAEYVPVAAKRYDVASTVRALEKLIETVTVSGSGAR